MPELPEVEVVRRGLAGIVSGREVVRVRVLADRPVRRHLAGPEDFVVTVAGRRFAEPRRRGKFIWLPFEDGDALMAHLGMSGQFRSDEPEAPLQPNTRVILDLSDGRELRFVDQRMFGGLWVSQGGAELPAELAHIALDPFDPAFDAPTVARSLRRRRSGIKRVLLDQKVVSGIGNIYADESLWAARLHYDRPASTLRQGEAVALLESAREVMASALKVGGTSFDALYVDVNGSSGYFSRALNAYGQTDRACARCGTPIVREHWTNRSSFRCPKCQPAYRGRSGKRATPATAARRTAVGSRLDTDPPRGR